MTKIHYIYRITNKINNKIYIGQTVNPNNRWYKHKAQAAEKKGYQNQLVSRAIKKYGNDAFEFLVLCGCKTQDDADELERQFIIDYDCCNLEKGYNIESGGLRGKDPNHTPWNKGLPTEQQPMFGKRHSDESKLKSSISNSITKKLNPPQPNSGCFTSEKLLNNKHRLGKIPWNKGKCVLTDEQIKSIRDRLTNGEKITNLATEFNLSRKGLSKILIAHNKT